MGSRVWSGGGGSQRRNQKKGRSRGKGSAKKSRKISGEGSVQAGLGFFLIPWYSLEAGCSGLLERTW